MVYILSCIFNWIGRIPLLFSTYYCMSWERSSLKNVLYQIILNHMKIKISYININIESTTICCILLQWNITIIIEKSLVNDLVCEFANKKFIYKIFFCNRKVRTWFSEELKGWCVIIEFGGEKLKYENKSSFHTLSLSLQFLYKEPWV